MTSEPKVRAQYRDEPPSPPPFSTDQSEASVLLWEKRGQASVCNNVWTTASPWLTALDQSGLQRLTHHSGPGLLQLILLGFQSSLECHLSANMKVLFSNSILDKISNRQVNVQAKGISEKPETKRQHRTKNLFLILRTYYSLHLCV